MRTRIVPTLVALSIGAAGAALAADFHLDKPFDLASGATLTLRAEVGDVTIRGAEGSRAQVTIDSDRSDFAEVYNVTAETRGANRLELVVEKKHRGPSGWFESSRGRTTIAIVLPRSASAEVSTSGGSVEISSLGGTVQSSSSGGALHVADIGGTAKLSSSGGRVTVERIGGALTAESSGGGVEVHGVGGSANLSSSGGSVEAEEIAGDLEASSSGGGVRIREAHGRVEAESSGGPVKVGFAAGNARGGRVGSSGGGVEIRLDPAAALEIDASASGGSVRSDLPVTVQGKMKPDSLRGKLNGGGALLELRSSGGGITIAGR